MATAPLRIVLTNDDGYNAPGLTTLYSGLVAAGFDVHIVAPAVNQSAQGSSLGGTTALATPVNITEFSPGNFYVDGKPATAALTAIDDLFAGNPPDIIISGTNRGDNAGESANISGTVNNALQGLFEGVPAIAISADLVGGSYDIGFARAANFLGDFLHELQDAQGEGQPLLPEGEGLTINVPGVAEQNFKGVTVTTITTESSAFFPYTPTGAPLTFAEVFTPNTSPSGSPTSEGSQFLTKHITISPIDGNWGATNAVRDDLAVRVGSSLSTPASAPRPLDILLVDEDGHGSAGLTATRDSLLAAGYDVTVLAPSTDQSGVGSALYIAGPITLTQFSAHDFSANLGTPASLVAVALDPQGLLNGDMPDLVVVGADQGNAVGIENANHSATLGGAITALFNYGVPSIALTTASAADFATGAHFLTSLIETLQLTQGPSSSLLPEGVGLSINVPVGASIDDYAFTNIDIGTDANLSVLGNDNFGHFSYGAPVAGTDPHSEGDAYNARKITVSPIDGSFAVHDSAAYDALAALIGTTYGDPNDKPVITGDLTIAVSQGGSALITTADLNEADPDSSGAELTYRVTATAHGHVFVHGLIVNSFSQVQLAANEVSFIQDGTNVNEASFTVSLSDHSGISPSATVHATVSHADLAPGLSSPAAEPQQESIGGDTGLLLGGGQGDDVLYGGSGSDTIFGGTGDDTIVAAGGNDLVDGGAGNDVVYGAAGSDTIFGGDGSDTVVGDAGNDLIDGGSGNDVVYGGTGSDTVFGGDGNDILVGYGVASEADSDALIGGNGDDSLYGGGGADVAMGGAGNDWLIGDAGDDLLDGGAGNDSLVGGAGADRFVLRPGEGYDAVVDFVRGEDHVDLTAYGFGSVAALESAATVTVSANAVALGFSDGSGIALVGIQDFNPSDFVI